ncbi:transcriptional regulator [Agaricicola taiwanensis]|uniref:Transcriptional regulator n=1 Tax=Agaricicola taiwanensis TaxID=591372 RepID=A0A8J3E1B2_9RHOB|nr:LysR family transcriptional regulator [Agaricicola taiwanensis]GGE53546.1 transcriptional regulator [Agaricicola taiwanensis]
MAFTSDSVHVFLAVLDHGSFSAAARHLGRVPSAVSMAIAGLEAELDVALFDRRGREPRPTPAARALEPQARLVAAQVAKLSAQALSLSEGLERRLTLAITPELSAARWTSALALLGEEFPLLEVEVRSAPQEDALALLYAGAADLAIVFERPAMNDREGFQEIGRETLVAVASCDHPLASSRSLRAEDLIDQRQVAVAGRGGGHIDPRLVLSRRLWRTDSHLVTLGLVQAGLGWAFLPEGLVDPLFRQSALVKLNLINMTNEVSLWVDVVWPVDRPLGLGARRYLELMAMRAPEGRMS